MQIASSGMELSKTDSYFETDSYGAGIAQWLERRTHDSKVVGSNPCRSSERIFISRVDFLC